MMMLMVVMLVLVMLVVSVIGVTRIHGGQTLQFRRIC